MERGGARAAGWSHFPHGADVGVRGVGATPALAFAEAARALFAAVVDLSTVRPTMSVAIVRMAPDLPILLVDWLNALIYESATRKMLFSAFDVEIDDTCLSGRAYGEPIDVERHAPAIELKGATFTALQVARGDDGLWQAQCVVDV